MPIASNGFPLLAVGGHSSRPSLHADQRAERFGQDQPAGSDLRSGARAFLSHPTPGASHPAWIDAIRGICRSRNTDPAGAHGRRRIAQWNPRANRRGQALLPGRAGAALAGADYRSRGASSHRGRVPAGVAAFSIGVCSTWSNHSSVTGSAISRCSSNVTRRSRRASPRPLFRCGMAIWCDRANS